MKSLFYPLLLLALIVTGCMESNSAKDVSDSNKFDIGETVEFKKISYKITEVERKQGTGSDVVTISYEATNSGKEAINIANGMIGLLDDQDRNFENEIVGSDPPGSLNPGLSGKGIAKFEIPKDASGLIATLREDLLDFGGAKYKYVKLE